MLPTLLLALTLAAQQSPTPDPKLHADTVAFVEASGTRKLIQADIGKTLDVGVKSMKDKCPTCTQQFYEEWVKRMTQRFNVDDLVNVYVETYEKYLTDPEILELTDLQRSAAAGTPSTPSPELKARLTAQLPSILSEIAGRCTRIGAKLGAQVGGEIGAEHPEYLQGTPTPPQPPPHP